MKWQRALLLATGLAVGASIIYTPERCKSLEQKVCTGFEEARQNPAKRQEFLNHIFEQRRTYGVEGWDSFSEFIYDPDFELEKAAVAKANGVTVRIKEYSGAGNFTPLMATPYFGIREVPLAVYVGKRAFQECNSQDDFLSCFDNESFHAALFHTGRAHIPTRQIEGEPSQLIFDMMSELYSFEKQFYYIDLGRRNVSDKYLGMVVPPARALYRKLQSIAAQKDDDGIRAGALMEALESRPTIRFFRD